MPPREQKIKNKTGGSNATSLEHLTYLSSSKVVLKIQVTIRRD